MASFSMLRRPPVSYHILDNVESSMCAVCPAIASLALMEYGSHSRARFFNTSEFLVSTSTFSLYTCKAAFGWSGMWQFSLYTTLQEMHCYHVDS